MVGDTVITGSDDWTARMWSISRGTCDAVLASLLAQFFVLSTQSQIEEL